MGVLTFPDRVTIRMTPRILCNPVISFLCPTWLSSTQLPAATGKPTDTKPTRITRPRQLASMLPLVLACLYVRVIFNVSGGRRISVFEDSRSFNVIQLRSFCLYFINIFFSFERPMYKNTIVEFECFCFCNNLKLESNEEQASNDMFLRLEALRSVH